MSLRHIVREIYTIDSIGKGWPDGGRYPSDNMVISIPSESLWTTVAKRKEDVLKCITCIYKLSVL